MPAPIAQNKYKEIVDNNVDLRSKMRLAFIQACESLSNTTLGTLEDFEVILEGVKLRYRSGDQITISDYTYNDASPALRKQGYDRLEKFMKIAMDRYNNQFNL